MAVLLLVASMGAVKPAGAATPHYLHMAELQLSGHQVSCADLVYAARQALIEPVEVHWLADLGVRCPNQAYVVMLALSGRGLLTCDDVRWNAAHGGVWLGQADHLLSRLQGCELSVYERLVTLTYGAVRDPIVLSASVPRPLFEGEGVLSCSDINWHERAAGSITPVQAAWLRDVLLARGISCSPPAPPPPGAAVAPPGGEVVGYTVEADQGCHDEGGRFGHTAEGRLAHCIRGAARFVPAPPPGYTVNRLFWRLA